MLQEIGPLNASMEGGTNTMEHRKSKLYTHFSRLGPQLELVLNFIMLCRMQDDAF
jgi:hypothetical protein